MIFLLRAFYDAIMDGFGASCSSCPGWWIPHSTVFPCLDLPMEDIFRGVVDAFFTYGLGRRHLHGEPEYVSFDSSARAEATKTDPNATFLEGGVSTGTEETGSDRNSSGSTGST
jgi:hypothetical protein